jgi:squalene-hopene/tetraprenyl-beta-curcumene cyclase
MAGLDHSVLERQNEERQTPEGGLRSHGSMSYSGLKSMIYARVTPDDPRVKAVVKWIREHYDLTTNPGMGDAGLNSKQAAIGKCGAKP